MTAKNQPTISSFFRKKSEVLGKRNSDNELRQIPEKKRKEDVAENGILERERAKIDISEEFEAAANRPVSTNDSKTNEHSSSDIDAEQLTPIEQSGFNELLKPSSTNPSSTKLPSTKLPSSSSKPSSSNPPSSNPSFLNPPSTKHSSSLKPLSSELSTQPVSRLTVSQRKQYYSFHSKGNAKTKAVTASDPAKAELHKRFVQKLGAPEALRYHRHFKDTAEAQEDQDHEEQEDEEGEDVSAVESKSSKSGKHKTSSKPIKSSKTSKTKLTPLEEQYINLKRANPDTLLVVEVGYKFRFFGTDAQTASRALNLFFVPGRMSIDEDPSDSVYRKFASTSFPVLRLPVHVKRLVEKGYKVGVVRQMETAALKAAGDNRYTPFERKLTHVYTRATYFEDEAEEGIKIDYSSGYLLALHEEGHVDGVPTNSVPAFALLAVDVSTGDIIHDTFKDSELLSELETRLLHILPCELLLVGDMSSSTHKLLNQLPRSFAFSAAPRVTQVKNFDATETEGFLCDFYVDAMKKETENSGSLDTSTPSSLSENLETVLSLPSGAKSCLRALIEYLKEFYLESVFYLSKSFHSFSSRNHMLLNGNTLNSLEIFQNQTDHRPIGSLFWILDHCRTSFGQRLLRKWVSRPLLDREQLELRLDAVTELKESYNHKVEKIANVMSRLPDLEKGLVRIHYGVVSKRSGKITSSVSGH